MLPALETGTTLRPPHNILTTVSGSVKIKSLPTSQSDIVEVHNGDKTRVTCATLARHDSSSFLLLLAASLEEAGILAVPSFPRKTTGMSRAPQKLSVAGSVRLNSDLNVT